MTPEEYERIKEAEKKHLRAIKELKTKLRQVERQNKVNRAVQDITDAPGEDILNTHSEMIDRLAQEAVEHEARLEMALSNEAEEKPGVDEVQPDSTLKDTASADAELQQLRAQELVRQMKIQMGLENLKRKQDPSENVREKEGAAPQSAASESDDSDEPSSSPGKPPEKTIGRMPNDSPL